MSGEIDIIGRLQDWWEQIVGGTAAGGILSYIGIQARTISRLKEEKADKDEVARMVELLDKRIERGFQEAREDRKAIEKKLDVYMSTQNSINLQLMDRTKSH